MLGKLESVVRRPRSLRGG